MEFLRKFTIIDKMFLFYSIFCIFWIIRGHNLIDGYVILLSIYIIVIAFVVLITLLFHFTKSPVIEFIRDWYSIFMVGLLFSTTTKIDLIVFREYLDPVFQYYDQLIFGYQPAIIWGTFYDFFVIQEFFHFSYFTFYIILFGIPIYIYIHKEKSEFTRTIFNIVFVYIFCYFMYIIFPVIGGRALRGALELTQAYRHGLFTHIMAFLYNMSDHWGGSFPSSHVSVAFAITLLSFRYFKRFAWLLLINTICLSIATVFCHYHYFVAILAGYVYGFIMFGVSEFIFAISYHK